MKSSADTTFTTLTICHTEFRSGKGKDGDEMKIERCQTDVLIIGGGTAGCYAALTIAAVSYTHLDVYKRQQEPITVGETVDVFLYRLFVIAGEKCYLLENQSLQDDSVFI